MHCCQLNMYVWLIIFILHFLSAFSVCICILTANTTTSRPKHQLTTESTVDENVTLGNTTYITNQNGSVGVTQHGTSSLVNSDDTSLSVTTDTFAEVTFPSNPETTTYGSGQSTVGISQADFTEATSTEPLETTTKSDQFPAMVTRTASIEVPMDTAASNSANSGTEGKGTNKRGHFNYKIALRIPLSGNETVIDKDVNMDSPINASRNEDADRSSEFNTDTTSAATAAVITGTTTRPPTPVTIDAESMAEVWMCLTDARHKASDALKNYVSRKKSERNVLDYTQGMTRSI